MTTQIWIEEFYRENYRDLQALLVHFFQNKNYQKIIILADNLDKAWDHRNDLSQQSEMILSLLEFINKVPRELKNEDMKVSAFIFLREDIFQYIRGKAQEPDKLISIRYAIRWGRSDIKNLIEKRFAFITQEEDPQKIWGDYFKFKNKKEDPFDIIFKRVTKRPRDIIYFVIKLFEYAVNEEKQYVAEEALEYATDEYVNLLHANLIAELRAEYPEVEDIMNEIQRKYYGIYFEYTTFLGILSEYNMNIGRQNEFIDSLFKNDYIRGQANGTAISNIDDLNIYHNKKNYRNMEDPSR